MGVIIGMDPHKASATIEVVDERGAVVSRGRFGTDREGYKAMLAEGALPRWPRQRSGVGGGGLPRHRAAHRAPPGARRGDGARRAAAAVGGRLRCGCSPPATAARPTRSMRTRWRWRLCTAPGLQQVVIDEELIVLGMLALIGATSSGGPAPRPRCAPAAPLAVGAVPRRGEAVVVRGAGAGDDRHHPTPRHRRADPPAPRGRADRRDRDHRPQDQGDQEGARAAGRRPRLEPARAARHRPVRSSAAAR